MTARMRKRFYATVKMNSAPACRGLQLSSFGSLSSPQATIFTAASKAAIRYLFVAVLSCAATVAMLPGLSNAAKNSPAPSPAQLAFMGLKDWNGGPKPHFDLEQLRGGHGQLSQYRDCIVLVHFFATWCASCHDEITSLQRLIEQLKSRAVAILAIDVADLDLRAKRYFENNRVGFPILLDRERETAKAWDVYSLPMTFILDKSLRPKYWTETSLDWNRPEIVDFLHGLASR